MLQVNVLQAATVSWLSPYLSGSLSPFRCFYFLLTGFQSFHLPHYPSLHAFLNTPKWYSKCKYWFPNSHVEIQPVALLIFLNQLLICIIITLTAEISSLVFCSQCPELFLPRWKSLQSCLTVGLPMQVPSPPGCSGVPLHRANPQLYSRGLPFLHHYSYNRAQVSRSWSSFIWESWWGRVIMPLKLSNTATIILICSCSLSYTG